MNNHAKKIIALIALIYFGFLLGAGLDRADAAYSNSGSVSVSSELRLTILPAIEQIDLGDQTWQTPEAINRQISIGVRANHDWFLNYQIDQDLGRVYSADCQTSGTIGERNWDNSFQIVGLDCWQKKSAGDRSDQKELRVVYQIQSALR